MSQGKPWQGKGSVQRGVGSVCQARAGARENVWELGSRVGTLEEGKRGKSDTKGRGCESEEGGYEKS